MTGAAVLGLQSVIVGAIAGAAAVTKIADRDPERTVARTALARLIADRRASLWTWYALAGLELLAGVLACSRIAGRWSAAPVGILMVGALLYGSWAVRAAPDKSCGCLGRMSSAKVTRFTVARTGVFLAMAALGTTSSANWDGIVAHGGLLVGVAGLTEFTLAVSLFPEVRDHFRRRTEPCETRQEPLAQTLARLRAGSLWAAVAQHLEATEPADHWRQACWRYLAFAATFEESPAIAVFAVRIGGTAQNDAVAFVDRDADKILGRVVANALRDSGATS